MPSILLALVATAPPVLVQEPVAPVDRYPRSSAQEEGLSPESLAALDDLVRSFVDGGEVVGAELHVIKNGRTVLHTGHGWRDRDDGVPMEPGGVFCVRSMTKPLTGTAVRMLVEDGLLDLDDRVAEHLASFDTDDKRSITVDQLLHHTSGLPLSSLLGTDLHELGGVVDVADLGASAELVHAPGTAFRYSDQGTDTLAALIEVVTGAPAADFVRARVLEPLGMRDSALVLGEEHPLRDRACSKYTGSPGAWTRYWDPTRPPLFPFFLGSQSLYSTTSDYARFLELWLGWGRVGPERLLRATSVRRALEPDPHATGLPTGLPGATGEYGSLMRLWLAEPDEDGERDLLAFGHDGSDGTFAWAFPAQRAVVLYFTQSRGTTTGLRVEERLGELLLGVPLEPIGEPPPLEQYLGYYREDENDRYRAVVRDGDGIALEVLGRAVVPLEYAGGDRWKLRPQPSTMLAFERDVDGAVVGYRIGEKVVEHRFEPSPDLPSAADVAARVAARHGIDLLEELGPARLRGRIAIESMGVEGESTSWFAWPDRWRTDEVVGGESGRVAFDGDVLRYESGTTPLGPVEEDVAELLRLESPFERFGDWRRTFPDLVVVQRIVRDDEDTILVRTRGLDGPASTFYVDAESGTLGRIDRMTYLEGLGRVGAQVTYGDFRDVSGVRLPHATRTRLAHPWIGVVESTVESVELGVELPDGHFALSEPAAGNPPNGDGGGAYDRAP